MIEDVRDWGRMLDDQAIHLGHPVDDLQLKYFENHPCPTFAVAVAEERVSVQLLPGLL